MPFGIGSLDFIDDAVDSVMNGLDSLFSNKEERQKAKNQLRKLKNDLKGQTQDHLETMAKIYAEDRQQARTVQQKTFEKAWWMMPVLAIMTFLAFFGVLFTLVFTNITPQTQQPLLIMLGTLGTIVTQIAAFLWGSSQGSKNKDEHIRRILEQTDYTNKEARVNQPETKSKKQESTTVQVDPETLQLTGDVQAKPPRNIGW